MAAVRRDDETQSDERGDCQRDLEKDEPAVRAGGGHDRGLMALRGDWIIRIGLGSGRVRASARRRRISQTMAPMITMTATVAAAIGPTARSTALYEEPAR